MFIFGYKLSDYQQTQITGSLHMKIIAVGQKNFEIHLSVGQSSENLFV